MDEISTLSSELVVLLLKWSKENYKNEPEQVSKNIQLIVQLYSCGLLRAERVL